MTRSPLLAPRDRTSVVLVVDDVERNLQIVGELLTQQSYEVLFATSGPASIERAEAGQPDLILLDLMMPGMDGIEVCRRLQQNPATQDIPIIFVTAAHDAELAARGLTEGAVDFVTKPFHAPELLARVSTHVALKQARDETRRVIAEKNELMATVAHDLKNPLGSIRLAGRALQPSLGDPAQREMADIIVQSCDELLGLIEERLARNAREATLTQLHLAPLNLTDVLSVVVSQNRPAARAKSIHLELALPANPSVMVQADFRASAQVFDNLISNAIKFSPRGNAVQVEFAAASAGAGVRVGVRDHGPGCSAADRPHLFQPYHRLSARPTAGESSTGLGLSIAHQLTEKMGGRIGYEDTPGGGATFWVELPAAST